MFALPSIMYFRNFESVFNAVDKGLCKYGILPIENSSYGSVNEVYDLMKKYRFHIVRSSKLKINHSLLANTGTKLEDIREIYTHDQALGQCSAFVNAHENIRFTTCENTAAAAKLVAESGRKDAAAISSGVCASLYGLTALEHDIQDSDDNYTRFICISKSLEIYPGSHKISLMMAISHTPGSLYQTVAKFASLGLNLCRSKVTDRGHRLCVYVLLRHRCEHQRAGSADVYRRTPGILRSVRVPGRLFGILTRFGLIGRRLSHSYSKLIHEKLGRYRYGLIPLEADELESFVLGGDWAGAQRDDPPQDVIPLATSFRTAPGASEALTRSSGGTTERFSATTPTMTGLRDGRRDRRRLCR